MPAADPGALRFIRIGQQTDDNILVISGLTEGEQLVLPNQLNNKQL